MIRFSLALALCLPAGPVVESLSVSCRSRGQLCTSTSDCCKPLGLHCLESSFAGNADVSVTNSSAAGPGSSPSPGEDGRPASAVVVEKRCSCLHGFPPTADGRGCANNYCAPGGSFCDSTLRCCPGYKCAIFLPYCVRNFTDLRFEGGNRDFAPPTTTRVYLSNFSAVSFLVVKLVLKIFVIIACGALLQDCFRRKRRGGIGGGGDAFDVLPLRRVPGGAAAASSRGRGPATSSQMSSSTSTTPSMTTASASRQRRSRSRERRLLGAGAARRGHHEPEEPPPSYEEVTAPPPAYDFVMRNDEPGRIDHPA